MARTLAQVRELTARQLGLFYFSGTADAGGSTTLLRDEPLKAYTDDRLNGFHILLTSGSPTFTELFITDFAQANGDCTFVPALGAAPNTLTYEILPFSGTEFLRAIQEAVLYLYDTGLLTRQHWVKLVAGSPLFNADWSAWDSATVPTGWARNGTGTIARIRGAAANDTGLAETVLRLSTTADYVRPDANYKRYLWDMRGTTVKLYCPVRTSTASIARVNLYTGSNNYSPYHDGDGTWQLLSKEVTVSSSAGDIEPRLYNDGTANVDFGMPFLQAGITVREYPFPVALMPDGPSHIRAGLALWFDPDAFAAGRGRFSVREIGRQHDASEWGFLRYHDEDTTTLRGILDFGASRRVPSPLQILTAYGDGPLTVPATATGTENLEVSYSESLLLASVAARKLLEKALVKSPVSLQQQYADRIARLSREIADLSRGAGQARDVASLPLRW